jgi:hypothetical protein
MPRYTVEARCSTDLWTELTIDAADEAEARARCGSYTPAPQNTLGKVTPHTYDPSGGSNGNGGVTTHLCRPPGGHFVQKSGLITEAPCWKVSPCRTRRAGGGRGSRREGKLLSRRRSDMPNKKKIVTVTYRVTLKQADREALEEMLDVTFDNDCPPHCRASEVREATPEEAEEYREQTD